MGRFAMALATVAALAFGAPAEAAEQDGRQNQQQGPPPPNPPMVDGVIGGGIGGLGASRHVPGAQNVPGFHELSLPQPARPPAAPLPGTMIPPTEPRILGDAPPPPAAPGELGTPMPRAVWPPPGQPRPGAMIPPTEPRVLGTTPPMPAAPRGLGSPMPRSTIVAPAPPATPSMIATPRGQIAGGAVTMVIGTMGDRVLADLGVGVGGRAGFQGLVGAGCTIPNLKLAGTAILSSKGIQTLLGGASIGAGGLLVSAVVNERYPTNQAEDILKRAGGMAVGVFFISGTVMLIGPPLALKAIGISAMQTGGLAGLASLLASAYSKLTTEGGISFRYGEPGAASPQPAGCPTAPQAPAVASCADGKAQIEAARRANDKARLVSLMEQVPAICERDTPPPVTVVSSCADGKAQIEAARRANDKARLASLMERVPAICERDTPPPVTVVSSCADGKAQLEAARRANDKARVTSLIDAVPVICERETPPPITVTSCADGRAQIENARRMGNQVQVVALMEKVPTICAREEQTASSNRDAYCARTHGTGYSAGHVLPDGRYFCKPNKSAADAWCVQKNSAGYSASEIDDRGGVKCVPSQQVADAWCNRNNSGSGWRARINANGGFDCAMSPAGERSAATADCRNRYGSRLVRVFKRDGRWYCEHRQTPVARGRPQPRPQPTYDPAAAAAAATAIINIIQSTQGGGRGGGGMVPQSRCHRNPYTGQIHCGAN
ncbi:MAG: hypothetical protein M5U07_00300 [Xanthobacteraceae bacterium]|nr:hypothetical protein [Xanthobacteraceae bacterium]